MKLEKKKITVINRWFVKQIIQEMIMAMRSRDLVTAKGNVRAVDEAVTLNGVVWWKIGEVAVVDSGLIRPQVEVVSQIEQVIWCCCRCHSLFLFRFLIDCFFDLDWIPSSTPTRRLKPFQILKHNLFSNLAVYWAFRL